jgi:ABC-type Fe3+ transport system permease subunit
MIGGWRAAVAPRLGAAVGPVLWLVAFVLIGLPLALVLGQAFVPGLFGFPQPDYMPSLDAFAHVLRSAHLMDGILGTIGLGVVGALVSVALGAGLALLLTLTDLPGRRLFAVLPWGVFATPSYFKGLAWVLLMAPGGYLVNLGLIDPATGNAFFSPAGLMMVLAVSMFPIPYFIIRARLQGFGGEFIDAARMASAGPWRIVTRIVIPMLLPAIALALLTCFAEVVGDFGIAATIARSMNVGLITYNIFAATASYPVDFPAAGVQALLLALLVAGSIVVTAAGGGNKSVVFVSGRNRVLVPFALGRWRAPTTAAAALLVMVAAVLPLAALAGRALTVTLSGGLSAANFSLAAFGTVFDTATVAGQGLVWSFGYGLVAALVAVAFALALAYHVSQSGRRAQLVASGLALTTVALPGVVLAFGYILVYDRLPGFASLPLYGSRSLLVIGYVASALPYCLLLLWAAMGRLGGSLHEAARLAGVSPVARLIKIVLPLTAGAIVMAFGITAIRSIFELPMSRFLLPLAGPPLPALIVDDFQRGKAAVACALAIVTLLVLAPIGGLAAYGGQALQKRRGQS